MQRLVIVGNSAAGLAAIEAIRARDRRSPITLIAAERHPPYSRVMLTYLLAGKLSRDELFLHRPDWYRQMGVKALSGRRAVAIDTRRREIVIEPSRTSHQVPYDRLLIATGALAQRPALPGIDLPGVFCLRDLDDAVAILQYAETLGPHARAVFLGGGPVCLQALTALADRGMKVTLVVRSPAIFSQL
ncbi:MAG TPA: FAD-dependent oxidoreductase, partial [Phycisphaerae bacterium]|nr:FAD-dependent oxidoreductase [Phycisphaerae bacterium]